MTKKWLCLRKPGTCEGHEGWIEKSRGSVENDGGGRWHCGGKYTDATVRLLMLTILRRPVKRIVMIKWEMVMQVRMWW